MARQLREIMIKDVVTLPPSANVTEAAARMRQYHLGAIVVQDQGNLCGVVTDRDIAIRVVAEERDPATTPLSSICSKELAVLSPNDAIDRAVGLMREKAVRRMPVVDDGHVVGIVSLGDLAIERDGQSALGRISAAPPNH